ncbi:MAG: hypothetical protein UY96_C0003G0097 [Parcubacteria group bacterium GW2011_GWB1_56_8]|nr:MAG: hypothetical protein UY96_C0003G0097 [Parcubacteria group bacterium GW2011_GWB1_56_8]
MEREAIVSALKSAPNITEAAKQLGASRRTIQNRMRHYNIPPGKAGRPRELLPYRTPSVGGLLALAGIAGGAFLVGRWFSKRTAVVGAGDSMYLIGIDILSSRA